MASVDRDPLDETRQVGGGGGGCGFLPRSRQATAGVAAAARGAPTWMKIEDTITSKAPVFVSKP
jgi:hypothetical protein